MIQTIKPAKLFPVLLMVTIVFSNSAFAQITLESNSNRRRSSEKPDTTISNYYFRYKQMQNPGLNQYGLLIRSDKITDVGDEYYLRRQREIQDSLTNMRFAYASLLRVNAQDVDEIKKLKKSLDSTLNEIGRLSKQAAEFAALQRSLNVQRVTLRLKSDSAELATIELSFKEVENNLRRLLHIAWDFDKMIDTTKEVTDYNEFFHSIVNLRADMESLLENDFVMHYAEIRHIKADYYAIFEDSVVFIDPAAFDRAMAPTSKNIKLMHEELRLDTAAFHKVSSEWNLFISKFIRSKKAPGPEEKKVDVSALPFFNVIPGIKDVNSSLSVFGSNKPSQAKNGVYTEFGGFTGLFGNKDETNLENLLIPESSNYGFFWKLNLGLVPSFDTSITRIGINAAFHYLGKSFKLDTTDSDPVKTALFQGKFGLEYVLVKSLLSVYSNVNTLSLIQNKELFNTKFNTSKDLKGYIDFGFRMLLEPGKGIDAGKFKLYFDLNFIVNGGDIKVITNSKDNIIPNIRFGLRTTLGPL